MDEKLKPAVTLKHLKTGNNLVENSFSKTMKNSKNRFKNQSHVTSLRVHDLQNNYVQSVNENCNVLIFVCKGRLMWCMFNHNVSSTAAKHLNSCLYNFFDPFIYLICSDRAQPIFVHFSSELLWRKSNNRWRCFWINKLLHTYIELIFRLFCA